MRNEWKKKHGETTAFRSQISLLGHFSSSHEVDNESPRGMKLLFIHHPSSTIVSNGRMKCDCDCMTITLTELSLSPLIV